LSGILYDTPAKDCRYFVSDFGDLRAKFFTKRWCEHPHRTGRTYGHCGAGPVWRKRGRNRAHAALNFFHAFRKTALANDPNTFGLGERLGEFTRNLIEDRPVTALGQKCGMDREDQIAVDLLGNVMTCQNTGAKGEHKIGHVDAFAEIALATATHFAFRPDCMACPVVQLCKGSCMFLEGEFFAQSCHNEYAYNLGMLRAALYHLTGLILARVEPSVA
jgi:uncharacterized protein